MANPIGPCGLCKALRELRDSHLIPAAIYKLSREDDRQNPNPVVVRPKAAGTISRQVSAHFLCADCEKRFSQNGEQYVIRQCARPDGQFALRQLLGAAPIVYRAAQFAVYEVGSVLGGNVEQYLYFAASIFWRAAARNWTWQGDPIRPISLGPTYREQFRLYLLGQAIWPPSARPYVHVSCDNPIDLTTVLPCSTRVEFARRHKFYVPGILFIHKTSLLVGKDKPPSPSPPLGSLLHAKPRGGSIHTARAIGRVKSTQASRSRVQAPLRVRMRSRTLRPGPPTDATIPKTKKARRRRR